MMSVQVFLEVGVMRIDYEFELYICVQTRVKRVSARLGHAPTLASLNVPSLAGMLQRRPFKLD